MRGNHSKAEEFTSEPAMKHFLENTPNENAAIWHQSIGAAGRADPNERLFIIAMPLSSRSI